MISLKTVFSLEDNQKNFVLISVPIIMVTTTSFQSSTPRLRSQENQAIRPIFTPRQIALFLLSSDIAILLSSLQTFLFFRTGELISLQSPWTWIFTIIFVGGLYLADTYRPNLQVSGLRAPARALVSNFIVSGLWATVIYVCGVWGQGAIFSRGVWPAAVMMFSFWTSFSRVLAAKWLKAQARSNSWLLLGFDRSQESLLQDFKSLKLTDNMINLLDGKQTIPSEIRDDEVGNLDDLEAWLTQPWNNILISNDLKLSELQLKLLKQVRLQGVPVYRVSDLYEYYLNKVPAGTLQDTWFTFSAGFHLLSNRIGLRIKRLGDILLATLVLLLVLPVMSLTAIAIKLDSPGAVFYSQFRTGRNMKPFRVYKFRSMYQDAENSGIQWASERDPRITRVGNFIRLVRIDELPQLWNVLRGDMSMIGPRPERPEFDEKLASEIPHYTVRYMVKPGITGWAQVIYPYGASVEDAYEKLSYDLYYIKNYSFWLDIAIVFKTLRVILLGKGR